MATQALPAGGGGGGAWVESFLPPRQHFSINCRHFPSRTRGAIFHQISKDFYSSAQLEYFFTVCDVKKHAVSCKKNLFSTDGNFHQQRCTFQSGKSVSDFFFYSVEGQDAAWHCECSVHVPT